MVSKYLFNIANGHPDFDEALKRAVASEDKNWKFKKDPLIEEFIKDFNTAKKQTKKKKYVGAKFFAVVKNSNYDFNVDTKEELDSEMDLDDDEAIAKREKQQKKAKRAESKKKDDMEIEDEK